MNNQFDHFDLDDPILLVPLREGNVLDPGSAPTPIAVPNGSICLSAVGRCTNARRGEAAEAAFVARAKQLGFSVLVPWGNSDKYDAVVDSGKAMLRMQVKSATSFRDYSYGIKATARDGRVYTAKETDFVAGYVFPENLWYMIPIEAVGGREHIHFFPYTRGGSKSRFERYREAWCLLDCARKARGWEDIPAVCRSRAVGVQCGVCPLRG
jgi:hypothetical protein